MNKNTPHRLSAEAMNDLRAIYEEEFDDDLTDDEIEDMGIRLLRFFSILTTPSPVSVVILPNEQEQKALDFIDAEIRQGRSPSVRGIAQSVGFKSSRSGHKLLNTLITKGWVGRRLEKRI